jgi:predicted membrane protein
MTDFWNKTIPFNPDHECAPHANLQWISSDTEEKFNKQSVNGLVNGYSKTSITYKLNEYGYRTESFSAPSNKNRIITMGASSVFGVGHRIEDIWPTKFAAAIPDSTLLNLATPGCSADRIVRILLTAIDILQPTMVAILWPMLYRFEVAVGDEIKTVGPWSNKHLLPSLFVDPGYVAYQHSKNVMMAETLLKLKGIPLCSLTYTDAPEDKSTGRDGHRGVYTHDVWTEKMLAQVPKTVI